MCYDRFLVGVNSYTKKVLHKIDLVANKEHLSSIHYARNKIFLFFEKHIEILNTDFKLMRKFYFGKLTKDKALSIDEGKVVANKYFILHSTSNKLLILDYHTGSLLSESSVILYENSYLNDYISISGDTISCLTKGNYIKSYKIVDDELINISKTTLTENL
jgi:hypothetical protein